MSTNKTKIGIYGLLFLCLIVGEIIATVLIFNFVSDNQNDNIIADASNEADVLIDLTNIAYEDLDYVTKRNIALFEINGNLMPLSTYQTYLGSNLNILPDTLAVQFQRWVPKILHQDREMYENYGKAYVSSNFEITTFMGSLTALTWNRTQNETVYYSLMLSDPPLPQSIPSGGDFLTSLNSDVFIEALESEAPFLTRRIETFQFLGQMNFGIEYYSPVYLNGNKTELNLLGFVQLLYVPSLIMDSLLEVSENDAKSIQYLIFDQNSPVEESLIYRPEFGFNNIETIDDLPILESTNDYVQSRIFSFINRQYKFVFVFTDKFTDEFDDFFPESVLIFLVVLFLFLDIIAMAIFYSIYRNYKFKKQESFNTMSAYVSHEMRNPINVIKNITEFVAETLASLIQRHSVGDQISDQDFEKLNEMCEQLEHVANSSNAVKVILDDSLIIQKLQQHSIEITQQSINLEDLVNELKISISHKLQQYQGVDIKWIIHDPTMVVHTDYQHLLQILINLLTNAIKFSENSEISFQTKINLEGKLVFQITDHGCGIPYSHQKNIFKPFYQLKNGHGTDNTGIGMGLYICKKLSIILKMDLDFVSSKSSTHQWQTTFWLVLPSDSQDNRDESIV